MKNIILLLIITVFGFTLYSQVKPIRTLKIDSKTTDFDKPLSAGTYIFDMTTLRPFVLTQAANSTNNLNDDTLVIEIITDSGIVILDTTLIIGGFFYQTNVGNSVFIGESAGNVDDLTDNKNVLIGYLSGALNTTGHYNTAVGGQAFYNNTTGIANTAIGNSALTDNDDGDANTAIGMDALSQNTHGEKNVGVGNSAIYSNSSNDGNTAIGYDALHATIYGHNTAIGCEAGSGAAGAGSVFIGYQAGKAEADSNKLYIDNSDTTAPLIYGDFTEDSISINGSLTVNGLISQQSTGYSVFLGEDAGIVDDLTDNYNVFIGFEAGKVNTSGLDNTIIGAESALANTLGIGNSAYGRQSLYGNIDGDYNTAIGLQSLWANTDGDYNTSIGHQSMFIGTTGSYNATVGYRSLRLVTGDGNVGLGFEAGKVITTGINSIYIGRQTVASAVAATNEIVFGYDAVGKGDSTGIIGGTDFKAVWFGQNGTAALYGGSITLNGGYVIKSTTATITASTTQTQGQQPLTTDINEISTVGNANDAVTLMTAVAGLEIFIINNGSNTLQIFPASSDDLGAGVNSSTTLAAGSNVTFVSYNTTNWEIK